VLKIFLIVIFASFSKYSFAFGIGAGIAAVDDMSDNAQPAALVQFAWTDKTLSQLYYWGRDYGPVSERQSMLTLATRKTFPGTKLFNVRYGVVGLVQQTSLYKNRASREQPDAPEQISETNYNAGAVLGIGIPYSFGRATVEINWDSHIFMVGSSAIIYLASARRQTLGLTFGVDI